MRRVLLIDNYDSFTYNLVQMLAAAGAEVTVRRNDVVLESDLDPADRLVVSPGPGRPEAAGRSLALIRTAMSRMPVLGVCLGHQAVAQQLGAEIVYADRLMHGKTSPVYHEGRGLFSGLPNPFAAGRYHSLAVQGSSLPEELVVTAHTSEGEIMGLRHCDLPTMGVQFHPESVLTPDGGRLLKNFLTMDTFS